MADTHFRGLSVRRIPSTEIAPFLKQRPTLQSRMAYPSYFCTASWLEVVLRHADPANCLGLVVYSYDEPIALLPLEWTRNWIGGRDLRYLGYRYDPDPLGVICSVNDLPRAIAAIRVHLQAMRDWDRLILDYMLAGESDLWLATSATQCISPYLPIDSGFEEMVSSFPRKKRYNLRRCIARARESELNFQIAETTEQRVQYLDALFRLHRQRSDAISRKSSLACPTVEKFHYDLVKTQKEACLYALMKGSRFAAVLYGFYENEVFYYYQIAHDPSFDSLSPGKVLLSLSIEAITNAQAREFNFLQGDETYKNSWASATRQLIRVKWSNDRLRSRVLALGDGIVSLGKQLVS